MQKHHFIILAVLLHLAPTTWAVNVLQMPEIDANSEVQILNPDSLLQKYTIDNPIMLNKSSDEIKKQSTENKKQFINYLQDKQAFDSLANVIELEKRAQNPSITYTIPQKIEPIKMDSLLLLGNPFFIELVFKGYESTSDWKPRTNLHQIYYQKRNSQLIKNNFEPIKKETHFEIIHRIRTEARNEISRKNADLYAFIYSELPDPQINQNQILNSKPIKTVKFVDEKNDFSNKNPKLTIKEGKPSPWTKSAVGLAQFSQNYASPNWYQGASSNLAVLGTLNGKLNYDDQKYIQWENFAEWRMGFNTNPAPSLRAINTNDDILRATSKLGVKAGGNFFYSSNIDFSTQLFNNYKSITSKDLKSTFLTPVRLNISIGMDYKVDKTLSLMVSPISYKYIYLNDTTGGLRPNLFGIAQGKKVLSEVGSLCKIVYSFTPLERVQIDTKFSFYTNYQKVEIDWETICNLTINRFLSTRIIFNPRYDNTIIGEKAGIQLKQLMSVGFSYKFIN